MTKEEVIDKIEELIYKYDLKRIYVSGNYDRPGCIYYDVIGFDNPEDVAKFCDEVDGDANVYRYYSTQDRWSYHCSAVDNELCPYEIYDANNSSFIMYTDPDEFWKTYKEHLLDVLKAADRPDDRDFVELLELVQHHYDTLWDSDGEVLLVYGPLSASEYVPASAMVCGYDTKDYYVGVSFTAEYDEEDECEDDEEEY